MMQLRLAQLMLCVAWALLEIARIFQSLMFVQIVLYHTSKWMVEVAKWLIHEAQNHDEIVLLFCAMLLGGFALRIDAVAAGELKTATIVKAAADTKCLDYRVVGACLWLDCNLSGCQIKSSPQVAHYLPDALVLAYTDSSPWAPARAAARLTPDWLGGGGASASDEGVDLRFHKVDIFGSPALTAIDALPHALHCRSVADPLSPYFFSDADFIGWRLGLPDSLHPDAFLPGRRLIGSLGNIWGAVFPRSGFVLQADRPKAAAVAAQRAADIVTRRGQSHVYRPMLGGCGDGCDPPEELNENDAGSGKWQMLYPKVGKCEVFGDDADWSRGRYAGDGRYAWHLWRPYRCCSKRGQRFLRSVSW